MVSLRAAVAVGARWLLPGLLLAAGLTFLVLVLSTGTAHAELLHPGQDRMPASAGPDRSDATAVSVDIAKDVTEAQPRDTAERSPEPAHPEPRETADPQVPTSTVTGAVLQVAGETLEKARDVEQVAEATVRRVDDAGEDVPVVRGVVRPARLTDRTQQAIDTADEVVLRPVDAVAGRIHAIRRSVDAAVDGQVRNRPHDLLLAGTPAGAPASAAVEQREQLRLPDSRAMRGRPTATAVPADHRPDPAGFLAQEANTEAVAQVGAVAGSRVPSDTALLRGSLAASGSLAPSTGDGGPALAAAMSAAWLVRGKRPTRIRAVMPQTPGAGPSRRPGFSPD